MSLVKKMFESNFKFQSEYYRTNQKGSYKEVIDYFSERAKTYDSIGWTMNNRLLDEYKSLLETIEGHCILDVATGTGIIGEIIKKSVRSSKVIGLDISSEIIKKASSKLDNSIISCGMHIPFLDSIFDVVCCRQGIQYMEPKRAISEFVRVCKPLGYLLISNIVVPSSESKYWYKIVQELKKPIKYEIFNENDINNILKENSCIILDQKNIKTRSSLCESISKSRFAYSNSKLIVDHYLNAPDSIKNDQEFEISTHDITYSINWIIILAEVYK